MTSDEVLDLATVPPRVAVIGGGAIGCEFASTFADLGSEVTILEGLPKILPGLDADLAKVVEKSFKKKKIAIRTGVMVNGHTPNVFGGTTVSFGDGESVEVDAVVVSVGRRPFADQLGLDGTGVVVDQRGFVQVDEYCRTGEPDVYAVGDLIATPQLAHVAYAEAILVVKQVLGESPMPVAYDRVPWAIYCHPEVAWAGPDEEQARAAGHDVVVAKHPFKFNSRAMILGETEGLVKVIAKKRPDGTAGQVLGVHMVGPWVTEQLSGGYLAVNWEALRRRDRRVPAAAPEPVRVVRRDGDVTHRPQLQRLDKIRQPNTIHDQHEKKRLLPWQTSPSHNSAKRSPRAPSPSGSSRSATPSPPTSPCSRCPPTRSTPRCRRPCPGCSPRSGCKKVTPSTSAP